MFQGGKTITSSFEHDVSDTFISTISERALLEMTYISMSPKAFFLRGELRGSKATERGEGLGGGCSLSEQGTFCILSPIFFLSSRPVNHMISSERSERDRKCNTSHKPTCHLFKYFEIKCW